MDLKLLDDDYRGIYVWVRADDPTVKISPHFDYREDAIEWHERNTQRWDHYSGLPAPESYI